MDFNDLNEAELDEFIELSAFYDSLSVRGLSESIVISKSEVSECLKRLIKVGLLIVSSSFPLKEIKF